MDYQEIATKPIFFERNRVMRVYTGGLLFGDFLGDKPEDGHFPEEWISSSVVALNRDGGVFDGISIIEGTDIRLPDLLKAEKQNILGERDNLDVLVKYLDSAIRLPLQAHPDKAFSQKYFNSTYGKTESWIILATRPDACIYFGWADKITRDELSEYVKRSETEKNVMDNLGYRVPVKAGDSYLINAKVVHAIGAGCLILEVQEPTDFTVQPEYWCGDYHLNHHEMYLGLDPKIALDCFNYDNYGDYEAKRGKRDPIIVEQTSTYVKESIISYDATPCFAVNRYRGTNIQLNVAPAIMVVTEGDGELSFDNSNRHIKKGDYFILPYAARGAVITSDTSIELIECLGRKN